MEPELSSRSVSVEILIEFDRENNLDYSLANELDTREKAQVREYVQNIL
ncbi:MAG TPA: 16S rRNA (cytosine(967)-C(5))-methyltransferase RsmB, partial [Balneola sp.]|nr:16S rRNA (cytosine(967)-C(5))-methyltransferase RsmB [Balneola sp.]